MISAAFFYLFSAVVVASGFMVISARNPVHAVLFLILAFFNSAGLFVLLGAEFLAMILVIVYVGAVAVLFLFVVMMLDVDFAELRAGFIRYLPVAATIGIVLLMELIVVLGGWAISPELKKTVASPFTQGTSELTNTQAIGNVLYTKYVYFFEVARLILLTAMVGAIILTLKHKEGVKRQNVAKQTARRPDTAVEIKQVKPGTGL